MRARSTAWITMGAFVAGLVLGTFFGARALEAWRTADEDTAWEAALGRGTISALVQFIGDRPESLRRAAAQAQIMRLREDPASYEVAALCGTQEAMRQFLEEFPGHSRETAARAALARMEPRSVVELLAEGEIELEASGAGIEKVGLTLRRRVPLALQAVVPVGTYFVSRNGSQNMVATREVRVSLDGNDAVLADVPTACANRELAIPDESARFNVEVAPKQRQLQALMPVIERSGVDPRVAQAAVWAVTDDADFSDLGILRVSSFGITWGAPRAIDEAAAITALKLCADAGIEVDSLALARDRFLLVHGLGIDAHGIAWWSRERLERVGPSKERARAAVAAVIGVFGIELSEPDDPPAEATTYFGSAEEIALQILDSDDDESMAAAACEVLPKLALFEVRPALHERLTAPSERTRMRAVAALGGCKQPEDTESIAVLLGDPQEGVRDAAAVALRQFEPVATAQALASALNGESEPAAEAALAAMSQNAPPTVVAALVESLRRPRSDSFRETAALRLGACEGPVAEGALLSLLRDPDASVRLCVARSLQDAGRPGALDALRAAETRETDPDVRGALAEAILALDAASRLATSSATAARRASAQSGHAHLPR